PPLTWRDATSVPLVAPLLWEMLKGVKSCAFGSADLCHRGGVRPWLGRWLETRGPMSGAGGGKGYDSVLQREPHASGYRPAPDHCALPCVLRVQWRRPTPRLIPLR